MNTNLAEIIFLSILLIHIILSISKYFKHKGFSFFDYLVGLDKSHKFVIITIIFAFEIVNTVAIRSYEREYYKDVSGNTYCLNKNKFYIEDGFVRYTIQNDSIYLKNILIGYFSNKGGYKQLQISNSKGEIKLLSTPENTNPIKPLYKYMFMTNGEMVYNVSKHKNNTLILKLSKENTARRNIQSDLDLVAKKLQKSYDSLDVLISKNNNIINSLKNNR